MSKKLLLLLLALLCTVFCACQSGKTPNETDESRPPEQPDGQTVASLPDFFLDNVNRSGKLLIDPDETDSDSPGTMVDPACVPDSDRTALYGTTYRFRLTVDDAHDRYYFQYNTAENQLAVVVPCSNLPLLLVFRPEVESAADFADIARTGEYLTATLVYARNLANDQLMYLGEAYYMLGETNMASNPEATYLMGETAEGSTEVYGAYTTHVTTRFQQILSAYYHTST